MYRHFICLWLQHSDFLNDHSIHEFSSNLSNIFAPVFQRRQRKSGMNYFVFLLSTPTNISAVVPHFLSFSLMVRFPSWLIQVKSTTNFSFESTPSPSLGILLLHLILLSTESSGFLFFSSEVFPLAGKHAYIVSILIKIHNKIT